MAISSPRPEPVEPVSDNPEYEAEVPVTELNQVFAELGLPPVVE
jgi:hypothetical protein